MTNYEVLVQEDGTFMNDYISIDPYLLPSTIIIWLKRYRSYLKHYILSGWAGLAFEVHHYRADFFLPGRWYSVLAEDASDFPKLIAYHLIASTKIVQAAHIDRQKREKGKHPLKKFFSSREDSLFLPVSLRSDLGMSCKNRWRGGEPTGLFFREQSGQMVQVERVEYRQ